MDPKEIHRQILAWCPAEADCDYLLYTDGSGHADGYGGWAAYLTCGNLELPGRVRYGGGNGTSVERAELTACLSGLRMVLEVEGLDSAKACLSPPWNEGRSRPHGRVGRPLVKWFTDRESICLAAARNPDGCETYYRRDKNPDLWGQYLFYEQLFFIHPVLVPRNEVPGQALCDLVAGDQREMMKGYGAMTDMQALIENYTNQ